MSWVNLHITNNHIYWKVGVEMDDENGINNIDNFKQDVYVYHTHKVPTNNEDTDYFLIDKNGDTVNSTNLDFSNSPDDSYGAGNSHMSYPYYFNSGTYDPPNTESGKSYDNIKIYNGATQNITIKDGYSTILGALKVPTEIWKSNDITHAFNGASFNGDGLQIFLGSTNIYNIVAICFPPFTLVETDTGLIQIGDLKKGDLVKTSKGLIPLNKNIITNTPLGAEYVKFPKNFFSKNVPERDLYVTGFHPFSLGLKEGTDNVYNGLEAKAFLGNIEGIEEIHLDTKTYHNLIFYDMEEFSVEGMKVYSHHPNGFPYKLPENEYLNEVNKEERKLNLITWNDFIKNKPDDVELKKFISDKLKF